MNNLLFPAKNQVIHQLVELFTISNLLRYREGKSNPESSDCKLLEAFIQYYQRLLISFENELLQIAETTTQETLDHYFNELVAQVGWMQPQITLEHVTRQVDQWNAHALQAYEEMVAMKEAEFVASGKRDQYQHLQAYETTRAAGYMLGGFFPKRKEQHVHYRYICIESSLEQIDDQVAIDFYHFMEEQ